jgi:hypothetical protein
VARRPLHGLTGPLAIFATSAVLVTAGCAAGHGPVTAERSSSARVPTAVEGSTRSTRQPDTASPSPSLVGASPLVGAATGGSGTPDAVALGVAKAWFSWDTHLDGRPNDTVRRLALPLLTPALRRQVLAFTGDAAPGDDWTRWSARHARAAVQVALGGDDRPDDGHSTAWRQVLVRILLRGDAGWEQAVDRTVFVRLDRVAGSWLAADLQSAASG